MLRECNSAIGWCGFAEGLRETSGSVGTMLRRNTRLRREYLYRKSLEGKERTLYEKKRKIRQALAEGKPVPTELRNEEAVLREQIDLEDDQTQGCSLCFMGSCFGDCCEVSLEWRSWFLGLGFGFFERFDKAVCGGSSCRAEEQYR